MSIKHVCWPTLILNSCLLLLLTGCQEANVFDPVKEMKARPDWLSALRPQPIITAGQGIEKSIWNDPCVIKDGDQYIMYLTSSTKEPFKPPVLPFRAVSNDGINWDISPKTPLISTEGTPFVSIETPNVVKFNGQFHMYYSGIYPQGQVPSMAIGHAVSDDGINWKNDPQPVVAATGKPVEWNGYLVAEPGAVVHKDKIYLYFTAMGARTSGTPPQLQSIGLTTSSDGRNFDAQKSVLTQSSLYPPEKGFVGYSTPSALIYNNRIHLVFDVAAFVKGGQPEWQQVAIHHAVSADGINNFVQDNSPIITRQDLAWAGGEILAPSMLISNGKLKLWFAGHVPYSKLPGFFIRGFKGPEFGIGYAEMDLNRFMKDYQ